MKKYHDQVLRNIYKLVATEETGYNVKGTIVHELLTSAALPAHCYVAGFKNLSHALDVCNNEQNTTYIDLTVLANKLVMLLEARSYKQYRMPLEFYEYIVNQLTILSSAFHNKDYITAQHFLEVTSKHLDAEYGFEKQDRLLANYEALNPLPKNDQGSLWYDQYSPDEAYQAAWKKYFKYRSTLRFGAYWKFSWCFRMMLEQLKKVGELI